MGGSPSALDSKLKKVQRQYSWLAMSSGWSGFGSFSPWNIKQGDGTPIGGVDLDFDEGVVDIGAFVIPDPKKSETVHCLQNAFLSKSNHWPFWQRLHCVPSSKIAPSE